jgi:hypothetical protein
MLLCLKIMALPSVLHRTASAVFRGETVGLCLSNLDVCLRIFILGKTVPSFKGNTDSFPCR